MSRTVRPVEPGRLCLPWLVLALGACSDEDTRPARPGGAPGPVTAQSDDDGDVLDELRALPYAGGVEREEGEGDGVVLHDPDRVAPGATLYTIQPLARSELIAADGEVLRRWEHGPSLLWQRSLLLPGGDLLAVAPEGRRDPAGPVVEARYLLRLGPEGEVRWKSALDVHHDVLPVPDGELVALTFRRRKLGGIHPTADVRDERLTWIDADTGEVLRFRSLLNAIAADPRAFPLRVVEPSKPTVGPLWVDVLHANAVQRIPEGAGEGDHPLYTPGAWLVTFRNQDRVAVFDPGVERILWSWGQGELSGPHDGQLLENGHLLVFDNGLGRERSRVLELDPIADRIVWSWEADPPGDFYTASKGSAERLDNGNTLVAESDGGRIFEVTPDGAVVWEYLCPYDNQEGLRSTVVRARRVRLPE